MALFLTADGFEHQQMLTLWLAGPVNRLGYWSRTELWDSCLCLCLDHQAPLPYALASLCCEPIFFIFSPLCIPLLMSFFICLLMLTSHPLLLLKVLIPSLRHWIIETDWSSCSQLCVRVEREKDEKERDKKRGRYGGQTHPCLKGGFCREPQAGCQVRLYIREISHSMGVSARTHWCPILERKREWQGGRSGGHLTWCDGGRHFCFIVRQAWGKCINEKWGECVSSYTV